MPLRIAGADELLADRRPRHCRGRARRAGRMQAAFARALHRADDVQQVGVVALLGRRLAPGEALEAGRFDGVRPVVQVLSENGGLATT